METKVTPRSGLKSLRLPGMIKMHFTKRRFLFVEC